ncbi:MAG TPA: PIG-L family deacetylase [Jiangellaceae bacterium]|nr:PIG-L family deacetylase [Jiangellaceae bacterium]
MRDLAVLLLLTPAQLSAAYRRSDNAQIAHTMTFSGRTVLVLHAHPDDESIFTGATIRRVADSGCRVVLVTATGGELGGSRVPLAADETVAERRLAELESAAETLGVARLVLLGRRDSGLPDTADNVHPGALAAASTGRLARRVAQLAAAESAEAVIHDDDNGIYGHPDHIAVHRIGRRAAELAGITSYESTVDRVHIGGVGSHLLHGAAQATGSAYGLVPARITLTVAATDEELAAKRAAILAHASQVDPASLAGPGFADAYRYEWFRRSGRPTVLDQAASAVREPVRPGLSPLNSM